MAHLGGTEIGPIPPPEVPSAVMFIDTHCHLTDPRLRDDVPGILERARTAGVKGIVNISCEPETLDLCLSHQGAYQGLACALGYHPFEAGRPGWEGYLEGLRARYGLPYVVAVGEIGLDSTYEHAPLARQIPIFCAYLELARACSLPAVVHMRDAFEQLFPLLEAHAAAGGTGVLHCFTGTLEQAQLLSGIGFFISFSGILTFKNSSVLRATAAQVPLESILIETDSPYLAPVPHRGKTNEPAFALETAKALAHARGMSLLEVAEATSSNALRAFPKLAELWEIRA